MATEQTPTGPRDTQAERGCLAAGLWTPLWWYELRHRTEPADFSHGEHQRIAQALDDLYDIGPFTPHHGDPVDADWPLSLHVRVWAVATITDRARAGVLLSLARHADGRHLTDAATVHALARRRADIFDLQARLDRELAVGA